MTFPASPTDAALEGFVSVAPAVAEELQAAGFSVDGLQNLLGADGVAAMDRGEPEAVASAARHKRSPLSTLIDGVIIGDPAQLDEVLSPEVFSRLTELGVIAPLCDGYVLTLDIRPIHLHGREVLVFSDRDASMRPHVPQRHHVPGVGRASWSLIDISPAGPTDSVLDLGAGCGVQAAGQLDARSIAATDISERANSLARATLSAAGRSDAEVLAGSWFEPVEGRQFSRIVANPPFVVGPPSVEHVYRDSGLDLDGATETTVRGAANHLEIDGTAHILGSWAHVGDQGWEARVASWIPEHGVEAWIVQRDVVGPAEYAGTWLRDESIDPRSHDGRERMRHWLDHFEFSDVRGVGFGYISLQRIDGPSSVVCEELPQALGGPFHLEVSEHFARSAWLREAEKDSILDSQYLLRPGIAVERIALTDTEAGQGFAPEALRITRTDGPRWSHDVDESVLAVLRAIHPDAPLSFTLELLTDFGRFGDADPDEVRESMIPVVVDLVRHGFLIPTDILD